VAAAKSVEDKHDVTGKFKGAAVAGLATASTAATAARKKVVELDQETGYIDKARGAAKTLDKKLTSLVNSAREVSPEERQAYLATAGAVLGVATLFLPGDSKVGRAAAAGATGVLAAGTMGAMSDDHKAGTLTNEKAGLHAAGLAVGAFGGSKTRAVSNVCVCVCVCVGG
jgi:hypothetical protein